MSETEGWGFTSRSRKAHYFVNGTALCGRYGFRRSDAPHEPDTGPSVDDCTKCRHELDKRKAAA